CGHSAGRFDHHHHAPGGKRRQQAASASARSIAANGELSAPLRASRLSYFATYTRYITPAPSSETSSAPSGATATPTGLPFTCSPVGSVRKPVRNGSGPHSASPFLNPTNATWYPFRFERFQEPCSATKTPP